MERKLAVVVLLILFLAPAVLAAVELPSDHAKPVGFFIDGKGRLRPILKLPKQDLSLFLLVDGFLGEVINFYRMGDENLRNLWGRFGVEPDSPQASSILKAAFRAKAMILDLPPIPLDAPDQEFEQAQIRNHERRVRELRQIYVQMLRELRATNYPEEKLQVYLDTRVRSSMSITYYGEPDEDDRKFDLLEKSFAEGLSEEVEEGLFATEHPK